MNRRTFVSVSATLATTAFAGCLSSDQDGSQSSDGESGDPQSNDESGPVAPEDAVEHYDRAVELLSKNGEKFDEVRQQMILGDGNIDFRVTTITSRTGEARSQLEKAAKEDDGSLEKEIETLRRVATYQDALAQYDEEYLKLSRLINTGLDYYSNGQYQQAITTLQNAKQQVEVTQSALDDVEEELNAIRDSSESADVGNELRDELLVAGDDNAEIREELRWFDQLVPARIDEIRGEQTLESATNAFEAGRYSSARSQYADAENYYVSAETQLNHLTIKEETEYLAGLVSDSDGLACRYGYLSDASDKMAQASQAMQNGNRSQANQHIESADTYLAMRDTC